MLKKIENYFRWLFSSDTLPEIPSDLQKLPESKARIVDANKNGDTIKISKKKVVIKQKKPKAKSTKTKKDVKK